MRTLDELYHLYASRRREQSGNQGHMVDLALIYDGELVTRIAELDKDAEASVPNIVAQGIDAYARFSSSVLPQVQVPPVRRNIASSRRLASRRQRIVKGWWDGSKMSALGYQRSRYYYGYGSGPVILRSHPQQVGVPVWTAINPIGVLPGPRPVTYSPEVPDCFVATAQSVRWVRDNYGLDLGMKLNPDRQVEVVEYIDAEQVTCFVVGGLGGTPKWISGAQPGILGFGHYGSTTHHVGGQAGHVTLLTSQPNYAEMCTASVPGVVSLSKQQGFVAGILSKHKLHARLMALTVMGIGEGIRPDEWVEIDPTINGRGIIREADGLRGVRGVIEGGRIVVPQITPSYLTFQLIDRIEDYSRSEAGIVPEMGGESGSNIRTRSRGDAVASFSVDPKVREYHDLMQTTLEHENRIAIAIARTSGRGRQFSMYVTEGQETTREEYTPDEVFENDMTIVRYPVAGADMNGLVIAAAQSIGTGQIAVSTARRLNPLVEDPDQEAIDIRTEALEQVLLAAAQEMASQSPIDAARMVALARQGKTIEEIVETVDREARGRQASSGELGAPDGPVLPGSPEAQPGLGVEGGGGQAPPVIEEPTPSVRNLVQQLTASRRPAMTVPAERAG